MIGDPARRPSKERVRLAGHVDALVWVECSTCLGDGWHHPQVGVMLDRLPKTRKLTCAACSGAGARQVPQIQLAPGAITVPAPTGRTARHGGR
ncbi:hypothetical protein [Sphingomonas aquatilis]